MNVLGRTIRTTSCGCRGPTRTTPSTRSTISAASYSSSSSQDGMRMFFQWLEEKFGGSLPMQEGYDDNHQTVVVTRSDGILRYDDLCSLFNHEITVLKVSNYYPRTTAIQLGKELAKQAINDNNTSTSNNQDEESGGTSSLKNWKVSTARGLESSDVFTLGAHLPYNIAFNNPDSIVEEYYKKVPIEFKQRRQRRKQQHDDDDNPTTIASQLWPLDQLRLELDEIWKHGGAGLVHNADNGHCRGGGLPRIMIGPTRWRKGFVHVDEMAPLSTKEGLFSANIYLQLPDKKEDTDEKRNNDDRPSTGDNVLEIWPLNIRNRWDWYRNANTLSYLSSQDAEGQVKLRKALKDPIKVCVEPGDLIMICAQRPHCAIGFEKGVRVSLQTFVQYKHNQRLFIEG